MVHDIQIQSIREKSYAHKQTMNKNCVNVSGATEEKKSFTHIQQFVTTNRQTDGRTDGQMKGQTNR